MLPPQLSVLNGLDYFRPLSRRWLDRAPPAMMGASARIEDRTRYSGGGYMDALRAYHGDSTRKERSLARVRADRSDGRIRQGVYWRHDCPARSEPELGIPAVLARLVRTIFAGLPDEDATMFPRRS